MVNQCRNRWQIHSKQLYKYKIEQQQQQKQALTHTYTNTCCLQQSITFDYVLQTFYASRCYFLLITPHEATKTDCVLHCSTHHQLRHGFILYLPWPQGGHRAAEREATGHPRLDDVNVERKCLYLVSSPMDYWFEHVQPYSWWSSRMNQQAWTLPTCQYCIVQIKLEYHPRLLMQLTFLAV